MRTAAMAETLGAGLAKAEDGMRRVRRFEGGHFFGSKF